MSRQGTIKWFDGNKRYGFVILDGKEDAMLHVSSLQAHNITEIPAGSGVEVEVRETKRGLAVTSIIAIKPVEEGNYEAATVKWFNADRGYGFLTRGQGTPDVFIHAATLKAFHIKLELDQEVMVVVEDSDHGPKVIRIKLP